MNKDFASHAAYCVLSPDKIETILDASKTLLEDTGVSVHDKQARSLMLESGAISGGGDTVKIPRELVAKALQKTAMPVTLYNRDRDPALVLDTQNVYFASCSSLPMYLDPYTGESVELTGEHLKALSRLVDALPNIDAITTCSMFADHSIPESIKAQMAYCYTMQNTAKHINFVTNDYENCAAIIEMAAALCGGYEELKKTPTISCYAQPISPLTHSVESCRKLMLCGETGVPVVYMPYSMMGATAPMSCAGSLVQCFAEVLSGLVLHQLHAPGAPFIVGTMPTIMDMRTTIGVFAAPEMDLNIAASVEISHCLGLPFYGTAGCTDSKSLDYQTVAEATMSIITSALSSANLVHDIGYMDHGSLHSPELIVLCNELISMVKPLRRGISVDPESLCVDVIKEVGQGGHFLNHGHTLKHFGDMWYSDLFDHSMSGTAPSLNEKINKKTKEILETYTPQPLTAEQEAVISAIMKKWLANV
jgi:trimethylamine--corrinoid protein Co-methyltransferase